MKLATLRAGGRDGTLVVVRGDNRVFARTTDATLTLQAALDNWDRAAPALQELSARLGTGSIPGEPLIPADFAAPLPRAYEWIDASAFLEHVRLVRKARGAAVP